MNRRKKQEFPALTKQYNTRVRSDLLDQDYIHKLNAEEKRWLDKFNEETVTAKFTKAEKKYSSKRNLYTKKEQRQQIYQENNDRNNDAYSVAKARNRLVELKPTRTDGNGLNNTEDALIALLDAPDKLMYEGEKVRNKYRDRRKK